MLADLRPARPDAPAWQSFVLRVSGGAVLPLVVLALGASTLAAIARHQPIQRTPVAVATAEASMLVRINDLRAEHRLPPLTIDGELQRVATAWTAVMAARGTISHNPKLSTSVRGDWRRLGENVGSGGDPDAVFDGLVASPEHLHNLLDPTFDRIAITMRQRDGEWFITQDFADVPLGARLGAAADDVPRLLPLRPSSSLDA